MLIDTHCHLDFDEFSQDREAVIERAKAAGIEYIINIGSSIDGSRKSVGLASTHDNIFASVGVHPHHAGEITEDTFAEISALVKNKKVVAIGEVGLDYYKSISGPDKQKELFIKFIELSKKLKLPLIIHNRNAHEDMLDILKKAYSVPISGVPRSKLSADESTSALNLERGVMHCFSGDRKLLFDVLELGLFVSFTCNITFKNAASLREVAKAVPPDKLLLETDAPFLAPQKYRGKRNEPAYITELRDSLAELLGLPKDEVERVTTDNAKKLFGIAQMTA